MNSPRDCCLCSQIAGNPENDLIGRLLPQLPYERRVAMESQSFAVIPSLGPIVGGHVLLCPKSHTKNLACVPPKLNDEFQQLKKHLTRILEDLYQGPVHCFEHGSARLTGRILCTVDHAHLHFLPVDVEIWRFLGNELEWTPVESSLLSLSRTIGDSEYLFYESPDGRAATALPTDDGFESQYLRRVFCKALGREYEWNWRDTPQPIDVHLTFRSIFAAAS